MYRMTLERPEMASQGQIAPTRAGLEITFSTFPIMVIGNHDFFPIK
jgi:hypothetical protein